MVAPQAGRDLTAMAQAWAPPTASGRRSRPGRGIGLAGNRDMHDAEHRHTRLDQGDVDRELAVALDELLGAVERIDQPEPSPDHFRRQAGDGFLFRDDWNVGRKRAQHRQDYRLGRRIGSGDRLPSCFSVAAGSPS